MTPRPEIDVVSESPLWDGLPDAAALAGRAALAAVAGTGVPVMDGAEISILLADDATLRELNRTWRDRDRPTNVLSWPAAEREALATSPVCGDIAISWETLAREAGEEGKSVADHFTHLVVHGVLHLLGYDHETDEEAEEMEGLEVQILAGLGVADPYATVAGPGDDPSRRAERA
ncbi:rRNA maturation RNase YbeY [Camelimonas abortus]|uniref:Endoribonuclease YbeY n=1 Tax=Camelimonas abortus TaxID=1017184 RepID=A0ABV7LC14_9HYPH